MLFEQILVHISYPLIYAVLNSIILTAGDFSMQMLVFGCFEHTQTFGIILLSYTALYICLFIIF